MAYPRAEHPQEQLDKVYLQRQAEINNINFVDGTEVLNFSVERFQSVSINFANQFIKDNNARVNYVRKIKEMSNKTLQSVRSGEISLAEGVSYSNEMRNVIMDETRVLSSRVGNAEAIRLKQYGKTELELLDKYADDLFQKTYSQLEDIEQRMVQYHLIRASGRARVSVTVKAKSLSILGRVFWVVTAAFAIYYIMNAENKSKEFVIQGSTIGGGIAGGALGGAAASFVCGPASPICFLAFVTVGGLAGGWAGAELSRKIYEESEEYVTWNVF